MALDQLRSIRSIILATDLHAGSERVFAHALGLSLVLKADLSIIHVGGGAGDINLWRHYPAVRKTLVRWQLLAQDASRAEVAQRFGSRIKKVHTVGRDPASEVIAFANRHPANLLVVGSDARSSVARWLKPSVAAKISRQTRLLTLFLPGAAPGFVRDKDGSITLSRLVVPVDSSPDSSNALSLAAELAYVFGDSLVTVDVLHAGREAPAGLQLPPDDEHCRWQLRLLAGEPAAAIAEASQTADLIVMSTAGRSGPFDALLGSTAERLLAQAPCPLLAIPAQAH